MTERTETIAYLAGVIDSDGCINIQKRKTAKWAPNYQARITVKQVTPQAPELLKSTLGGSMWLSGPSAQRGRPLHVWNIHSHAAGGALAELMPHLRIKQEQARNAIALCELNASTGQRKFVVPEIVPGEPMVTIKEAAEISGRSYDTVMQAVHQQTIPFVRGPRAGSKPSIFIPVSFLPVWAERGTSPTRSPELTEQLEAVYQRGKVLNRVGI